MDEKQHFQLIKLSHQLFNYLPSTPPHINDFFTIFYRNATEPADKFVAEKVKL